MVFASEWTPSRRLSGGDFRYIWVDHLAGYMFTIRGRASWCSSGELSTILCGQPASRVVAVPFDISARLHRFELTFEARILKLRIDLHPASGLKEAEAAAGTV